jgi:hypothetical protein
MARRRKPDDTMTVQLSIDRIEAGQGTSEIAVLLTEDCTSIAVPRNLLPRGARPGDILAVTLRRDRDATRQLARRTRKTQDELGATDPGDDLHL